MHNSKEVEDLCTKLQDMKLMLQPLMDELSLLDSGNETEMSQSEQSIIRAEHVDYASQQFTEEGAVDLANQRSNIKQNKKSRKKGRCVSSAAEGTECQTSSFRQASVASSSKKRKGKQSKKSNKKGKSKKNRH